MMGGGVFAEARARESSIEITVTRADGRVERLDVVAYWHRNPLRRWAWHLRQSLKERAHGRARPE